MKKIFYWCPFIDKVATVKAVINSCEGLKKYTDHKIPVIIDAVGEFEEYEELLKKKKIEIIKLSKKNYIKNFPKYGFFASRILYIFIFLFSLIKLNRILLKEKPDYLIAHLITSLPIFLFLIVNYKTKLVLRISGFPKLNFLRKMFWKIAKEKISLITTPTIGTNEYLIKKNLFKKKKIVILRDPVINIKEINEQKKIKIDEVYLHKKKYFISIGRLTKQKNFDLLIKAFSKFLKENKDYNLVIIGEGEEKGKLLKLTKNLKISSNIYFLGYKKNVFKYLFNSQAFILSSKWEDPGFVLIEAAACKTPIISSDCPNGPKEFLNYGKGGLLFKNNNENDLLNKLNHFVSLSVNKKKLIILNAFKNVKKFTIFSHSKRINSYLN